jgi:hypothetical protein
MVGQNKFGIEDWFECDENSEKFQDKQRIFASSWGLKQQFKYEYQEQDELLIPYHAV